MKTLHLAELVHCQYHVQIQLHATPAIQTLYSDSSVMKMSAVPALQTWFEMILIRNNATRTLKSNTVDNLVSMYRRLGTGQQHFQLPSISSEATHHTIQGVHIKGVIQESKS